MLEEFIKDKVYYKIFDRSFKQSSHIYGRHKTSDATKLTKIDANILSVKSQFSCSNILILNQVHGCAIIDADFLENFDSNPVADAALTTKRDLILSIMTADCVPVFIASGNGSIIAAAHCGWRSAKSNIIGELVKKMQDKGGSNFKALIGPSIQQSSYEVSKDYHESFIADEAKHSQFFTKSTKENCFMFDLPAFVYSKLENAAISEIIKINEDTYSSPDKYPSYRRDCHEGKEYSENILSAIMIK